MLAKRVVLSIWTTGFAILAVSLPAVAGTPCDRAKRFQQDVYSRTEGAIRAGSMNESDIANRCNDSFSKNPDRYSQCIQIWTRKQQETDEARNARAEADRQVERTCK